MSETNEVKAEFNGLYSPFFFVSMGLGYIFQVCRVGFLIGISKAEQDK